MNELAFPQHYKNAAKEGDGGISVRDYFAAKAMQGIVTGLVSRGEGTDTEDIDTVVKASAAIADAMLKERANQ